MIYDLCPFGNVFFDIWRQIDRIEKKLNILDNLVEYTLS